MVIVVVVVAVVEYGNAFEVRGAFKNSFLTFCFFQNHQHNVVRAQGGAGATSIKAKGDRYR